VTIKASKHACLYMHKSSKRWMDVQLSKVCIDDATL